MKWRHGWKALLILALLLAWRAGLAEELINAAGYLMEPDGQALRSYLSSFGVWGPVAVIGLLILQAVIPPLPAAVVILTAIWLYGPAEGFVYCFIGGQLGAMITYWLGRCLGRPFLVRWLGERQLKWAEELFIKYGLYAVLLARLTPVLSLDAISYGAGASGMPFARFCLAVAAGQTPALLAFSFLGKTADNLLEFMLYLTLGGLGLAAALYWAKKRGLLQTETTKSARRIS